MKTKEEIQAAVDELNAVCKRHGIAIYGDDGVPVSLVIVDESQAWSEWQRGEPLAEMDYEVGPEVGQWTAWVDHLGQHV